MAKELNTIIVLRNDKSTDWASSEVVLREGELGVSYLDNGNVMVKAGDGEHTWADLKQVESVLEEDITLTYNFGRHVTQNGSVDAGGKDMTMTQWLIDALSEVKNPVITYPTATLSAGTITTDTGDKEIGSKITKFAWSGTPTYGSYTDGILQADGKTYGTYGTTTDNTSSATGLSASNFTWTVTNTLDSQTGNTEDGTFTLMSDDYQQINTETNTIYAYLNGKAVLDASGSRVPLNNVGKEYTAGKIAGYEDGTTETTFTNVAVKATGFRKPFWGWKSTAESLADPTAITSAQVRSLGKSGTSTAGLPTSLTVPAGTKQIYFAAKAGTKSSLTVKNTTKEPATGVACTKVASAVNVEGANGYTATAYDLWYINLDAAFTGETKLSLTWA